MGKMKVHFNEYNIPTGRAIYLPLVSGQLRAYAEQSNAVRESYQFMPFHFVRGNPSDIVLQNSDPSVAAFSVSMWNANLSLVAGREIKKKFPSCLTIYGGPQIPFDSKDFLYEHPFVDVTVRGEGEKTFTQLLERFADNKSRDFRGIPGISYRAESGEIVKNRDEQVLEKNLDVFPSPYLSGLFNSAIAESQIGLQAIVETNRGCPFLCAYCSWGQGGLGKRFRFYSSERVQKTAEWCGQKRIGYVFCADSNFGMFARDFEMANHFVRAKKEFSFPEKFRVCYAKNAEDTVFNIGSLLVNHGMDKGITLSRQTNSPAALEAVGRKNIKMEVFRRLQQRYNESGIPTYTEFILGLPGETYSSFVGGLEEVINAGLKNQLYVYHCQVYPNTELGNKVYQEKHGISVKKVPLTEVHGSVRPSSLLQEYEEIIVSTNTLPREDWKRATAFSWAMQMLHGLKLGFFVLNYLNDRHKTGYSPFIEYFASQKGEKYQIISGISRGFEDAAEGMLSGRPSCRECRDFGDIYWSQEEAGFLEVSANPIQFFGEMHELCEEFLRARKKGFESGELKEVVDYQRARIPTLFTQTRRDFEFNYSIPQYFDSFFSDRRQELVRSQQEMDVVELKDFKGDKESFAREVLLYGRKSDKILNPIKWRKI